MSCRFLGLPPETSPGDLARYVRAVHAHDNNGLVDSHGPVGEEAWFLNGFLDGLPEDTVMILESQHLQPEELVLQVERLQRRAPAPFRLPVMEPELGGNELAYVTDCVRSNWISSQGSYVRRFEAAFADFLGSGQALAVSNGTTSLHLALAALGIGPGDEVLVPDLTFAARANTVLHVGARPVLVTFPRTLDPGPAAAEASVTPGQGPSCRCICTDTRPTWGRSWNWPGGTTCCHRGLREARGPLAGPPGGNPGARRLFQLFFQQDHDHGRGGDGDHHRSGPGRRLALFRDHGMNPARRYWHEVAGFNFRMTIFRPPWGWPRWNGSGRFFRPASFGRAVPFRPGRYPGLVLPLPCPGPAGLLAFFPADR